MARFPAEIFGHHWKTRSATAERDRQSCRCPFMDAPCNKKSTLLRTPFGVCSAQVGDRVVVLCPNRFLQHQRVFEDIARHHFRTTDNILVFKEVGLRGIGNFDYVLVRHKPLSAEIKDFVVVEFQGGQTTSTGGLVDAFKEFRRGVAVGEKNYDFGLNMADIWKRAFTQVLNKGIVLEKWGHKIYWVTQEQIFADLVRRYRLGGLGFNKRHSTVISLYDLVPSQRSYSLVHKRFVSASIDELFRAFRNNANIPSREDFLVRLQTRITNHLYISLQAER